MMKGTRCCIVARGCKRLLAVVSRSRQVALLQSTFCVCCWYLTPLQFFREAHLCAHVPVQREIVVVAPDLSRQAMKVVKRLVLAESSAHRVARRFLLKSAHSLFYLSVFVHSPLPFCRRVSQFDSTTVLQQCVVRVHWASGTDKSTEMYYAERERRVDGGGETGDSPGVIGRS